VASRQRIIGEILGVNVQKERIKTFDIKKLFK
jgi:hypothetical protein